MELKETEEFSKWLKGLRDAKAKAKVVTRLLRLANGNPGDVGPVGDGISELRIDFGPGYRVYYVPERAGLSRALRWRQVHPEQGHQFGEGFGR
jgi:putative addiction module killer protein